MTSPSRRIEKNKKLSFISFALEFVFWAPFLLKGLTWAMLYLRTQNYLQIVGTCPGHHGQRIGINSPVSYFSNLPDFLTRALQQVLKRVVFASVITIALSAWL